MSAFPVIRDPDRVRRLLALPHVRPKAMEALAQARVALVGLGGLGSGSAPYLAAAGVGTLVLVDPDRVAATDLGRQILYTPDDVGAPKVAAAAARLRAMNPAVRIEARAEAVEADNVDALLAGCDVVLDGLDQGAPREVLNRYAVMRGVPLVFAGALGYEGQVMVVPGGGRPCLACLFGDLEGAVGDCATQGVLGPLVGMVGALEAQEALKLLMGLGTPLAGRLWLYDAYTGDTRVVTVPPRPDCRVCGPSAPARTPPGRNSAAASNPSPGR
ncbi:MAG: HesA/MoeB/ThiF family protein [Actinomycetia bacterium]|nr:HesA/MoeB/ThiF family protein [Actinomycetes bacterium]